MISKKAIIVLSVVLLAVSASSCVTSKTVRYLQDMPKEGLPINKELEATICPYDEITIRVYSNGGYEEELVKPFNVMGTYSGYGGYGYLVDINGNIQFPILGDLHVEGLTRRQLQDTICSRLESNGYIKGNQNGNKMYKKPLTQPSSNTGM